MDALFRFMAAMRTKAHRANNGSMLDEACSPSRELQQRYDKHKRAWAATFAGTKGPPPPLVCDWYKPAWHGYSAHVVVLCEGGNKWQARTVSRDL